MARLRARLRLLAARNANGAAQKASLAAVGLLPLHEIPLSPSFCYEVES
jgi:hypothetical protein